MPDQEKKGWVIVFLIYADYIKVETGTSHLLFNEDLLTELENLFDDLINCNLNEERSSVYVVY
jgi:hypothetical protein